MRREKNAQMLEECTFSPAISESARYSQGKLPHDVREALQRPPHHFFPSEVQARNHRSNNMAARKDQDIRKYVARCEMIREKLAAEKKQASEPGSKYTGQLTNPQAPTLATARRAYMRQMEKEVPERRRSSSSNETLTPQKCQSSVELHTRTLNRHEFITAETESNRNASLSMSTTRKSLFTASAGTELIASHSHSSPLREARIVQSDAGAGPVLQENAQGISNKVATNSEIASQVHSDIHPPHRNVLSAVPLQLGSCYPNSASNQGSDVASRSIPNVSSSQSTYHLNQYTALDFGEIDILARIREETERNLRILSQIQATKDSTLAANPKNVHGTVTADVTSAHSTHLQSSANESYSINRRSSPHSYHMPEQALLHSIPQHQGLPSYQYNMPVTVLQAPNAANATVEPKQQSIPGANVYSYPITSTAKVQNLPSMGDTYNEGTNNIEKPNTVHNMSSIHEDHMLSEELLSRIMSSIVNSTQSRGEATRHVPTLQPTTEPATPNNVESLSHLVGLVAETILANVDPA